MKEMKALAFLVFLAPFSAFAEYWGSDTASLLKSAKNIEILKISAVSDTTIEGSVTESIRGRSVGTKVSVERSFLAIPSPSVGGQLLVICDDSICPRAVGIERGGYFVLWAQEPMDGAQVWPGIIERASLASIASGKTAPDLCVRATVRFIDDPKSKETFEGSFSALNGSGEVKGSLFSTATKASFTLRTDPGESGVIAVQGKSGVLFTGGAVSRAKDGCYELTTIPGRPLSRTPKLLKDTLAGKRSTNVIAKGKIHIDSGSSIKAGDYDLSIEVDKNGQLHFATALFVEDTISLWDSKDRVGFTSSKTSVYPKILLDLSAARAFVTEAGIEVGIAELVNTSASIKLAVFLYDTSSTGDPIYTSIGTATISHVAE